MSGSGKGMPRRPPSFRSASEDSAERSRPLGLGLGSSPRPRRPNKSLRIEPSNGSVTRPPLSTPRSTSMPASTVSSCPEEQEQRELQLKARMGILVLPPGKKHVVQSLVDMGDVRRIGSGISGEVYRMKHRPSGITLAAKKMIWQQESWEEQRRVLMDLEVMTSHHCPQIVEYYGSAIINNEVWVFMELMSTCLDRLLQKIKGPIPEDIVCKMCVSIVKALDYLKRQHSVIHRDVKPSNMLLDSHGNVKLCDFGISGRLVDSKAFTRGAGAAAYMAPERINITECPDGYDVRADVWSLGISLVELAQGTSPYAGERFKSEFELLTHIVNSPPPLLVRGKVSDEFYDFVAQCLSKDLSQRPQYPQLLKHPLILKFEMEPVNVGAWYRDICQTFAAAP